MLGPRKDKDARDQTPRVAITPAAPIRLHGHLPRGDSNCPVQPFAGAYVGLVSHYVPRGHSYRRTMTTPLDFSAPLQPVRFAGDTEPQIGKWIEAVWTDGPRLYGWYHAERPAACPNLIFVPEIGAALSRDGGLSWTSLGVLLRPREGDFDCGWRNGFFAGGMGDFCVTAADDHFYLHYSSYAQAQAEQGICVARYPIADRDQRPRLEVWSGGRWQAGATATPLWPTARSFALPDPDGFWGPAAHFNHALDCHVMLLNRTQGGHGDLRQEGVYISFNASPADPSGWSAPRKLIDGGFWYPQIVGAEPGDGDTRAGAVARLFMLGLSAWNIHFGDAARGLDPTPPKLDSAALDRLFPPPR